MHRNNLFPCMVSLAILVFLPSIIKAQTEVATPSGTVSDETLLFQEIPSVYGASKYEQKVTEAPSSVSIITATEIKKYGYRTLVDILRSVRGFYVTYDRNYSYVGARGFGRPADYNNRVLLLIDGHRTNDNLYDMAFVGTDSIIDVDLIDRVEIIRGPGSSLYGSNALFGVVNVITRRGRDVKGVELSGNAGSYDTYQGRLSYGNRFQNGIEAVLSGTLYDSAGRRRLYYAEYDTPATNNGTTNHTDYDQSRSFFEKISFLDFTLEGSYVSRTKGIPTGSFSTDFNDPGNKTTDDRGFVDLLYEHDLGRQRTLKARVFYDFYTYTGDYLYSGVVNKDRGYGKSWGGEVTFFSRVFDRMRVILGAEYTYNNQLDQQNYDVDPFTSYLDDKRRSQRWALYFQDEFAVFKQLTFTAGVRYDHYDAFGGTTNPRLALIYTPAKKSVLKFLYGTAFRVPSPFELYYNSTTNEANPDLKPEKIKTYELVFEQYIGDQFRATAQGFYYNSDNLINQTEVTPPTVPRKTVFGNIQHVESRGVELELENKWTNGVDGRISYTQQRTIDTQTHNVLSNSPEHMVKLNIAVPLSRDKIFAGIEEQYTSRRNMISGGSSGDFFITNITLYTQRIIKNFELSASVYNLFDKEYADPVSLDFRQRAIRQDGRTFRLKLVSAF